MCGRYYADEETIREIKLLVGELDEAQLSKAAKGDIFPSQQGPIIAADSRCEKKLAAGLMTWGFIRPDSRRLIINARAETALVRPMFKDSFQKRRCIIPAGHFYEWDAEKNKIAFYEKERHTLYMAGFYQKYDEAWHYTIITTKANESAKSVHDRMPLLLEKDELIPWIYNTKEAEHLLKKVPTAVTADMTGVQERLIF